MTYYLLAVSGLSRRRRREYQGILSCVYLLTHSEIADGTHSFKDLSAGTLDNISVEAQGFYLDLNLPVLRRYTYTLYHHYLLFGVCWNTEWLGNGFKARWA